MSGECLEAALVEFCAPALMGLKPAGLFRYQGEQPARAGCEVLQLGRELAPFGRQTARSIEKALSFIGKLWYTDYKVYHPPVQRGGKLLNGGLSGFYSAC